MNVPVRPAATVMLVRDSVRQPEGSPGIEVLLLKRRPGSGFVPGAHVFPGGAVDADDGSTATDPASVNLDDVAASRRLGLDAGGAAYWVAAIRETYEEAGLLLAVTEDGGDPWQDPDLARRLTDARFEVDSGTLRLSELCAREGLRLDLAALRLFGRWITPLGAPRRYDTRFFVARAPARPDVTVDNREAVEAEWTRPAAALERFGRGDMDLIVPTERSLAVLADFESVDDLLGWLDTEPVDIDDHGGWRVGSPGDKADRSVSAAPSPAPIPVGEP